MPIAEAIISLKDTDKTMVTDEEGRFDIIPLGVGSYTVFVKAEGYETQTFPDVVVKTGVATRLNAVLKASEVTTRVLELA